MSQASPGAGYVVLVDVGLRSWVRLARVSAARAMTQVASPATNVSPDHRQACVLTGHSIDASDCEAFSWRAPTNSGSTGKLAFLAS